MAGHRVLADAEQVAEEVARQTAEAIRAGAESVVLAGGTTPRRAYEVLAGMDGVPWGGVTVLFGDERCVAPTDPESNYAMAFEVLLSRVHPGSVHRIPGELGAELAARRYNRLVAQLEPLDLVLLGVGEDGHTASLFPGAPALEATGWATAVHDAPKPPPDRVTLTLAALAGARQVIIVATGGGKAEAVRLAREAKVPAGLIPGADWLLDAAAAGEA